MLQNVANFSNSLQARTPSRLTNSQDGLPPVKAGELGTQKTNEASPLRAVCFRLVAGASESSQKDNDPYGWDASRLAARCLRLG